MAYTRVENLLAYPNHSSKRTPPLWWCWAETHKGQWCTVGQFQRTILLLYALTLVCYFQVYLSTYKNMSVEWSVTSYRQSPTSHVHHETELGDRLLFRSVKSILWYSHNNKILMTGLRLQPKVKWRWLHMQIQKCTDLDTMHWLQSPTVKGTHCLVLNSSLTTNGWNYEKRWQCEMVTEHNLCNASSEIQKWFPQAW